jgi:VPDSG-CTERM motif
MKLHLSSLNKLALFSAMVCAAMFAFGPNASATRVPNHLLDRQTFFTANPIGDGQAERDYLVDNGYMEDCCQFATKWERGTGFEDPNNPFNQYFTITETSATTWHVEWNLDGSGFTLCGLLIKDGAVSGKQLYGFYGVSADELIQGEGDVSFADIGRNGRQISHLSFFVCQAGVPDGGTTVMLLGAALGVLGMARRYLIS